MSRAGIAALLLATLAVLGGGPARADVRRAAAAADSSSAPADTSFGRYLDALHDSTDTFFRTVVAPVDTAGLDSVLALRLVPNRLLAIG